MREIIFRGKQRDLAHEQFPKKYPKQEREFVYGTGVYSDGVNSWLLLENNENKTFSQLKSTIIDPETLGQFSGLRDSKRTTEFPEGQMIFEGDILEEEEGFYFEVVWEKADAKFRLQWRTKGYQWPEWNRGVKMRVIGNIHEHKYLLGGEVD